jgi:hypothetical protein
MQNVANTSGSGETLQERAVGELKEYAVITAYLWLLFALFSLHKELVAVPANRRLEEMGPKPIVGRSTPIGRWLPIPDDALHWTPPIRSHPLGTSAWGLDSYRKAGPGDR